MWNDHWSIMKPAFFIIWFSLNINFRFSIKWCSRAQKVIKRKYVKYTCSMETVHQNGRFTLFSSKFHSNINSILFVFFRAKKHLFDFRGFFTKELSHKHNFFTPYLLWQLLNFFVCCIEGVQGNVKLNESWRNPFKEYVSQSLYK